MHHCDTFKCIVANNIGMSIIVDDHIHFCYTGNFVVDFNTEKMLCGKIMPIVEIINCAFFVIVACLLTHIVKSVQKETTRSARGIKNIPILLWLHHFYAEFDNRTRRKVLTEITFEESIHKLLKSNTLNIKIGFA